MNNDIKQLSLDILRDIYGSSRRLAMYPLGHPITQETLKKPLSTLNYIFTFKHSFTIDLFKQRVLGEGVLLDDTVYVSGIALEMKKHKLSTITFRSDLAIGDLYHFLSLLVSRPGPYEDNMARILKAKNIQAIIANIDSPPRLYDFDRTNYVTGEKFLLEERIRSLITEKPAIIASYYMGRLKNDEEVVHELGIDFRISFLARYFKEVLLHLDQEKGLSLIESAVLSTNWLDDAIDSQAVLGLRRIFDDYLTENSSEQVLTEIYHLLKKVGTPGQIMDQFLNKSSFMKLKMFEESEGIVETLKGSDPSDVDPTALRKMIFKLASSQQKMFLQDLLDQLIRSLQSPTEKQRQRAAELAISAAEVLSNGGYFDDFSYICKEIVRLSLLPTQTLEPVEATASLIQLAIKNSRWPEFKVLCRTLRGVVDDHLQAESKREIAVSKLTEISSSNQIFRIACALSEATRSDDANEFFEGMSALGSREIIKMLACKLTHPDINIRSRMIKLLVSMKKDAGEVITEMLADLVGRVNGGIVSDEDWYYFRNALRVIKEVRAEEAIPYLEIMCNWPVARIKLEVVKTLENMPAESACKLLDKLSRDENAEVRKAAVVAMGLSGDKCMIPYLREIFMNTPECRHIVVASLGRIGDSPSRDVLIELFETPLLFKDLGISKKDSDELRATILKALSVIGDETSMQKIAEYSTKSFDKSIFGRDLLSNTAKILLGTKIK
jgi:HEAT repeat protein